MRKKLHDIFGKSIKTLIKEEPHAWWQLKREYNDAGYSHTAFGLFTLSAERIVKNKLNEYHELLVEEYVSLTTKKPDTTEIITYYRDLIVGEVCIRADVAARRTLNW